MSNSEPILSEFLTKEELADELGRNPRTLDRWHVLGMGPPRTHLGRKVLYRRASVAKWLVAQEHPAPSGGSFAAAPPGNKLETSPSWRERSDWGQCNRSGRSNRAHRNPQSNGTRGRSLHARITAGR